MVSLKMVSTAIQMKPQNAKVLKVMLLESLLVPSSESVAFAAFYHSLSGAFSSKLQSKLWTAIRITTKELMLSKLSSEL